MSRFKEWLIKKLGGYTKQQRVEVVENKVVVNLTPIKYSVEKRLPEYYHKNDAYMESMKRSAMQDICSRIIEDGLINYKEVYNPEDCTYRFTYSIDLVSNKSSDYITFNMYRDKQHDSKNTVYEI